MLRIRFDTFVTMQMTMSWIRDVKLHILRDSAREIWGAPCARPRLGGITALPCRAQGALPQKARVTKTVSRQRLASVASERRNIRYALGMPQRKFAGLPRYRIRVM
ncbi:hypothetical protein CH75_04610 [Dyella jiangningensis]|nr:hypothetical protein CH75_04610 [Dyella jiangningensis]